MELVDAYQYCQKAAFGHYENFPVASILLPAEKRGAIAAVYAFARQADDFADEAPYAGQRLERLDEWEQWLETPRDHPVFIALEDARQRLDLPIQLFKDLLAAFRQDVTRCRYDSRQAVLDYCRLSANPVGRLVLRIFDQQSAENDALSDYICTALQLTNFWQDVGSDARLRDRIYLSQDDRKQHGVTEGMLLADCMQPALRSCIREQVHFADSLFIKGAPLCENLQGRLSIEINLTLRGGRRVLQCIRQQDYDTLQVRPTLNKWDWFHILSELLLRKEMTA